MIFKNLSVALKDAVCTFEILRRIRHITESSVSAVLCIDTHLQNKKKKLTLVMKGLIILWSPDVREPQQSRFRPLVITGLNTTVANCRDWLRFGIRKGGQTNLLFIVRN